MTLNHLLPHVHSNMNAFSPFDYNRHQMYGRYLWSRMGLQIQERWPPASNNNIKQAFASSVYKEPKNLAPKKPNCTFFRNSRTWRLAGFWGRSDCGWLLTLPIKLSLIIMCKANSRLEKQHFKSWCGRSELALRENAGERRNIHELADTDIYWPD